MARKHAPIADKATEVPLDGVRASNAGHRYHEAWAARSALALLPPNSDLTAIAMEGLSFEDENDLSAPAIEVADLTRYYGGRTLLQASKVEVVQFKYSTARAQIAVRAYELVPTLVKFAQGESDRRIKHGQTVADRVTFEYATNRPIHPDLDRAMAALAERAALSGEVKDQAAQIVTALDGFAIDLPNFLTRVTLLGKLGDLAKTRRGLARTLASWSAPGDAQTRLRLRDLEHLVREKAGLAGLRNKLIERVSVLDELKIDDENDLYPAPDVFPSVAARIERSILKDVLARALSARLPLVLHGEGGMGKTVLMQALAERLSTTHAVVLFDGYGAGNWRDPSNPRHLASRTLVHLANLLAAQGLCDLVLPAYHEDGVLRAFRLRLVDAVKGVRLRAADAGIALVLDAIDHAALAAQPGQRAFSQLLLNSLAIDPIDGVLVIASCRSERRVQAVAGAEHDHFKIPAFSDEEVRALVTARDPSATSAEIAALKTRSGANPRCLDAFLTAGRPYENHAPVEGDADKVLDALIEERVLSARREAIRRGSSSEAIDTLLAGLAVLPPPAPAIELAAAQGLSASDVESFAADLAPLLERTRHGLMFRDEPTETLIMKMAAQNHVARDAVIERLLAQQRHSSYAARALPMVLAQAGHVDALIDLAFSSDTPSGTSEIGRRDIRLARIVAALQACARVGRSDDLLRLGLEASLVAAAHARADQFLYENPDLTAISGDAEAMRRLFASRLGNPQGRHSSLAIAYSFSGEQGEAERHAARAIDWYNHDYRDPDSRHRPGGLSQRFESAGFAYVRVIAGDTRRMFEWLGRNSEAFAFRTVKRMLDLGDCHASGGVDPPDVTRFRLRLSRCELALPGAAAAALLRSNGDPSLDRRFVLQLAARTQSDSLRDEEAPGYEGKLPVEAMLHATLRAADMKLKREAKQISARFEARTTTVFSFDDYRGQDLEPVLALVSAGVAGVLLRRLPTLIDLAPLELLQLVPASIRRRGPASFSTELQKRLKGNGARRGKRKRAFTEEDGWRRDRFDQQRKLVAHRLEPILPYAGYIADLVKALPASRPAIAARWLDSIENDIRGARSYEFPDQRNYLARMGGLSFVFVGTALHALDGVLASRVTGLLIAAKQMPTTLLLWACDRIAGVDGAQKAAMLLAQHIETEIRTGTDTAAKLADYGKLARAVWRTSPHDAAALFRKALNLAEAMGADDFERANSVLQLAANYRGPPLVDEASHALPRIFELQLGDEDRYPWREWADAMRGTAGNAALAMLSRLDDRSAAKLHLTLPPMLTALVEDEALPADIAAALIGIGGVGECRDFRLDAFARAAIPKLNTINQRKLFELLLTEIDREDRLAPDSRTISGLTELAEKRLDVTDPILKRLVALAPVNHRDGAPSHIPNDGSVDFGIISLDVNAIDEAIDKDTATHKGHRYPGRVLQRLPELAKDTTSRLQLLSALVDVDAALDDKLRALEPYVAEWAALSPAISEALPEIGERLARRHPDDLASTSWDTVRCWGLLERHFRIDRARIACATIIGFDASAIGVAGDAWLSLAAELSANVGQPALCNGLERFLMLVDRDLPDEVGDGGWQPGYVCSQNPIEAAAGLLWIRLGNPLASMRWRAAHAVVRMATFGRYDVIDALVERYDSGAGPFAADGIPFHHLDAQLFLLLALGRIARDRSAALGKHQDKFERIAFDDTIPHAAIQEAAIRVLRSLARTLPVDRAAILEQRLALANRSPFLPEPRGTFYGDVHGLRPEGANIPERQVYLDYDFSKYQVAEIIRLFRLPAWEVEDRIAKWMHRFDPAIESIYTCPRRHFTSDRSDSWSGGYIPDKFRYGGYLAWHGLQLAAGELLRERPCTAAAWDGERDAWTQFLAQSGVSRTDGFWLSEWSDLTPLDVNVELAMPERDSGRFYDHASDQLLAPIVGLVENRDQFLVAGAWETADGTDLSVMTVLAPDRIARAALFAGMLVEPFFRGLPNNEDECEVDFGKTAKEVRIAFEKDHFYDRALDRFDPYASLTAQERTRPAEWLQDTEQLVRSDAAGRQWAKAGVSVLVAEAWGGPCGRLDRKGDRGERLWADRAWLSQYLSENDLVLAGIIRAQRYKQRDPGEAEGSFLHRSLGFLLDMRGGIIIPKRVPGKLRGAVSALGKFNQSDYKHRFNSIMKTFNN